MSILATNTSINVGDTTTIIVSNLDNVIFFENNSIQDVQVTSNGTYTATVNPTTSTIYYVSGYNAIQTLIILNVTVYVKVTTTNPNVTTNFNTPISLSVIGSESYTWNPTTFLNNNNLSTVICTPLENISYVVTGTDKFSTLTRLQITVNVNTGLIFVPNNPTVYDGNLLILNVNYNNIDNINNTNKDSIEYSWKSNLFNYLPPNCVNYLYGNSIRLHPYKNVTYTVNAYDNGTLLTTDKITVTVILKPSNIIDIDILPYKLANLIINRETKELKEIMFKDKILSKKIIDFYYTTLQTAYRMEWTNKNGISYKIPWLTLYQINNEANEMILNFTQQWNFFAYINNNKRGNFIASNFAYLLNIVNEIYLEYVQKIYITPI